MSDSDDYGPPGLAVPRVTNALVAGSVSVTVVDWLPLEPGAFARLGLVVPGFAWDDYLTAFLVAPFVHTTASGYSDLGPLHLIANLVLLVLVGGLCERLFGRGRTLLVFLLSAITGSLVSAATLPHEACFSSSAGTLGLVGLVLGVSLLHDSSSAALLSPRSIALLAVNVAAVMLIGVYESYLNNVVHVTGLLTGMLLANALAYEHPFSNRWPAAAVSAGLVVATIAASLATIARTSTGTVAHAMLAADYAQASDRYGQAAAVLEQALASERTGSANRYVRPLAQNMLAWLYVESGTKLDEGIELSIAADRAKPNQPAFLNTLGYLYALSGNCREAADKMGQAASLDRRYERRRDEVVRACKAGERPRTEIPLEAPPESVKATEESIQARALGSLPSAPAVRG